MPDQIIVGVVATLWCVMHSVLITPTATKFGANIIGNWYRFIYVTMSCITLFMTWHIFKSYPGEHLYSWIPASRYLMITVSITITILAIKQYDNRFFLGISQITKNKSESDFNRAGILNYMRHPYYAAGIIFVIFYNDFTTTSIVWRAVFVLYFIVGAKVEENKLIKEHGQDYLDYMEEVPAFGGKRRAK